MNKIYTSIDQSRILLLSNIVPLETADGFYEAQINPFTGEWEDLLFVGNEWASEEVVTPAWSLTALLNALPSASLESSDDHYFRLHCKEKFSEWYNNPIDACFEIIFRLNQ